MKRSVNSILSRLKAEIEHSNRQIAQPSKFHLLRLLIYTSIMLAGLGAAYFYTHLIGVDFTNNWLALGGVVIAGIAGLEALTRWPSLSLIGLLLVVYFVNWFMPTGTNVSIDITIHTIAFLLVIWALRMLLIERRIHLAPSPLNLPVFAFIAAATLSLVLGNRRFGEATAGGASLPAQVGGWILLVFPLLLMLAAGNLIHTRKPLQWIVILFLGIGIWVPIERLLFASFSNGVGVIHPNSTSSIFWIMLTAIPAGQALFNQDLATKWRVLCGVLALLALAGGLQSTEKLAFWVPLLIALLILLWLWNWRWGLAVTAIGFIFALPVILWLVYTPATIYIYELNLPWPYTGVINVGSEFSIRSRYATWPVMFELVRQNPLFGMGPANYKFFTNQFRIWEYFLPFNSHNNYWDLLVQTGIIGFGLFAWLSFEITRLAWQVRKLAQDGFSKAYAAGVLAGFIAVLSAGMMDDYFMPFVYNLGFPIFRSAVFIWLFLGGVISLGRRPPVAIPHTLNKR